MVDRQQDLARARKINDAQQRGTGRMMESDSPDNLLTGALRAIGSLEASGDTGLGLKLAKGATVFVARTRLWQPQDIEAALAEGRKIEEQKQKLDEAE